MSSSNIRNKTNAALRHRHNCSLGGHTVPSNQLFSQASLETRFFPRQVPSLQVPAVDRDATPASHGDAVHDGDVGHRQLVDCQVQCVLLLQVGGLQVEYCCINFLPFLFFLTKR